MLDYQGKIPINVSKIELKNKFLNVVEYLKNKLGL